MTLGSLFAGIGGFDIGFARCGFKTIWQVEKDEYRRAILSRLFPAAQQFGDVHDCGRHNLQWVDVIVGGDPCQENSNARRSAESRSPSLGGEFIRIVDELRPRIVLRENPAAVRTDAPWPWFRFRDAVEGLGYAVLPFRLRACCTGADHPRERLFLLAELQDPDSTRLEGDEREKLARALERGYDSHVSRPARRSTAPRICGTTDAIPNRRKRLESLGNAVDVGVAEFIARCIASNTITEQP